MQTDIGDLGTVLFTRVEYHDDGVARAIFITEDGATFDLDHEALALRIAFLEKQGRSTVEERRAQKEIG